LTLEGSPKITVIGPKFYKKYKFLKKKIQSGGESYGGSLFLDL
jgi:hypothetical protein